MRQIGAADARARLMCTRATKRWWPSASARRQRHHAGVLHRASRIDIARRAARPQRRLHDGTSATRPPSRPSPGQGGGAEHDAGRGGARPCMLQHGGGGVSQSFRSPSCGRTRARCASRTARQVHRRQIGRLELRSTRDGEDEGGEALARALHREGVRVIFGLPGVRSYGAVAGLREQKTSASSPPVTERPPATWPTATRARARGFAFALVLPGPGAAQRGGGMSTAYSPPRPSS